jgi:hypothetical protein
VKYKNGINKTKIKNKNVFTGFQRFIHRLRNERLIGSEDKRSEDKGRSLNLLKKWPVVLNKSQIPALKKRSALQKLCKSYAHIFDEEITDVKILKKINNIKTETVHLRQLQ